MNARRIPPSQSLVSTAASSQNSTVRRILVVDDDRDLRRLNSVLLKRSGYQVDTAEDGAAALEALDKECYDVLLTDYHMPRLTGVELIQQLQTAHRATPVILMSGTMPTEELSQHPWLKIDALLCKPYSADELLTAVAGVIRANGDNRDAPVPPGSSDQTRGNAEDGIRC